MSSDKRSKSLADAFGIDADALDDFDVDAALDQAIPPPAEEPDELEQAPDIAVEVEPGVVKYGSMMFVQEGERLTPVDAYAQINLTITALLKHRLKRYAKEHRMSMVEVVREALQGYMKD